MSDIHRNSVLNTKCVPDDAWYVHQLLLNVVNQLEMLNLTDSARSRIYTKLDDAWALICSHA